MENLFVNDCYTQKAVDVSDKIHDALRPVIEELSQKHSLREINMVAMDTISQICLSMILEKKFNNSTSQEVTNG